MRRTVPGVADGAGRPPAGGPPAFALDELADLANATLPDEVWRYAAGAAGSGATLRRNLAAIDRLAFRPRVLRGVGRGELGCTFLGRQLALPVMLAPVGSVARFTDQGALASARAASAAGTASFVATTSAPALEDVATGSDADLYFQMYVRGDRGWIRETLARLTEHGYLGVCLTVDSAVEARWARAMRQRFRDRSGPPPNLRGASDDQTYHSRLTWDDLAWMCEEADLPVIVKGIVAPSDAALAVDCGAAAVYVSNHGGRNLDSSMATMEALPSIVDEVAGRAPILVDGGFSRGTDVVKAVALGASVVLIGRLQCWALAVGGVKGLIQTLETLAAEISDVMAYLGVSRLDQLGTEHLLADPWPPPYAANCDMVLPGASAGHDDVTRRSDV